MKAGKTPGRAGNLIHVSGASMEPGHEGREDQHVLNSSYKGSGPQWSPAMKAGKTCGA